MTMTPFVSNQMGIAYRHFDRAAASSPANSAEEELAYGLRALTSSLYMMNRPDNAERIDRAFDQGKNVGTTWIA